MRLAPVPLFALSAAQAPTMLATNTIAHSCAVLPSVRQPGAAMTGSTVTMVCSVKSCIRPRITIRKPRL